MKINYSIRILSIALTTLILFFIGINTFGQQTKLQAEHRNEVANEILPGTNYILEGFNTSFPAFVKFEQNNSVPYSSFFNWLREKMDIDATIDFQLLSVTQDELGYTHYRFTQTVKGIPVDLATYHLQVLEGEVVSFNGEIFNIPDLSPKPALTESQALQFALSYVGSDNYMWENPFWENEIKIKTEDPHATYYPQGELYWGKAMADASQSKKFSLVYRFDIYAEGGNGSLRVLVNANDGSIVNSFPLESNCSSASVNTIWNGNQTIFTDKYTANDFRLKDDCQSASIRIRDWNSATLTANPIEIENTTNTWTTMNERFGATVLWHTKASYSYFLNVHSRNSYDDSNGDVEGYINAVFDCSPPAGCTTTNNASMSFSGGTMKVGLGSTGTLANSWGTLDIIGHEYTHAVTGSSSQLVYQGESGALNESFSDIFGECIERSTTGSNDWLMGNDRTNGAIRSLQNPNGFGDPDTYLGNNWVNTGSSSDNGGVHTNSSVQNYWFYLLGVGNGTVTTGTNDNSDSYSVTGIGFNAARAIAYRNNVVKLTTNSNYASARAGAIASAEDLYGACSNEVIQVKNAWYAVGVGTPGMPLFNSSYDEIGSCSGDPFTIDLLDKIIDNEVTPSFTWTVNYNGLSGGNGDCLGGCPSSINETLFNNSSAALTATYTVTPAYDGCTGSSFVINKTVYPFPVGNNTVENILCSDDMFSIDLQSKINNGVAADFSWTVDYNGLTGGNGAGSGDFIDEMLGNYTGATASAVYTVSPFSEDGNCPGPSLYSHSSGTPCIIDRSR
ncbi:MAG: M4 family metallopeptidase [Bacteroidales bacterium]